ncbi:MAG: ABC transporter permease subunit [Thermomicrobiales bacterium]|jgi:ABC-2 type transport system permease protein
MGTLLRSELFRIRKRPQSWLMLVLAAVFVALIYGGMTVGTFFASTNNADDLRETIAFDKLRTFGLSFNALFGGIMLAIFASGIFGNEYSWNTIRPLLARARSRSSLVTAKLMTVLLYTLVFTIALALLTAGISLVATLVASGNWHFSIDELGLNAAFVLGLFVTNLPYVALAVLVAMWTKSNAAGIGVAIGISFIEPAIWPLLGMALKAFKTMEKGGLSWNTNEVLFNWSNTQQNWISVGVLLLYTVIFVALTYRVFLRRDVTSG